MSLQVLFISTVLIFLTSCKTAEQIQQEKLIKSMSVQMVQIQKLQADNTVKQQDIEEKFNGLTGNFEENRHKKSLTRRNEFNRINSEIELLKEEIKVIQQSSVQNRADLNQQKKLLQRILATLNDMAGKKTSSPYSTALALYKKRKYKSAKKYFLQALKSRKLSHSKKARSFHNIGMIDYMRKSYSSAIVYFSKLFTKYPKSSLAPNGLLYLAKSFNGKKQKEEARQTIRELLKRYPKSKKISEAKKYLKKI